ncbi:angiopoietin-related protein 7-like [Diabrotica virgifera virgifera]|uniref:Fibrinogen C-terminal domain-containing protein n=1 Tax=Diabrotica virgifera virgifera TaxID=50390 RepID=A0ABM5KSG4_DIAVI|nr:angiopoietin-related protein 7-like [Diabrotica virgifera virgifera]
MISFVILLLICVKCGVSLSPAEVPAANPVNVKFTVDFTAEGGANSWKNDVAKFLYPENEAFVLGTPKYNEKVSTMSSSVVDKLNSLQEYENTLKNVSDKLNSLQEYENSLKNVSDKLNSLQEYENTLKNVSDKLNNLQEYENSFKNVSDKLNSLQEYENTLKNTLVNSLKDYENTLKNVSDKLNSLQEYENTLKNTLVNSLKEYENTLKNTLVNSLQEYENTLKPVFDKLNSLQEHENTLKNLLNQCKYLVGKSQIPLCRLNPVQIFSEAEHAYPTSCKEILKSGKNKSDVYIIKPKTSTKPFAVLCDMETKGGGWTHIQKRFDGSQDFYLPWRDYKFGFGDLRGEFWIGLENIHHMTAFETSELLVELTDTDKNNYYAQYTSFSIGNEKDGYVLDNIGQYSGNAGDSLLQYHLNSKFSTLDVDLDGNDKKCAQLSEGAWWYKATDDCHWSNLNGKFMTLELPDAYLDHGLNWDSKSRANFAGSRMKIRPVGE